MRDGEPVNEKEKGRKKGNEKLMGVCVCCGCTNGDGMMYLDDSLVDYFLRNFFFIQKIL